MCAMYVCDTQQHAVRGRIVFAVCGKVVFVLWS